MKKTLLFSVCAALTASLVSCGGPGGKAKTAETADAKTAKKAVPEYTVVDNAQTEGYANYDKFYEALGMISNIIRNARTHVAARAEAFAEEYQNDSVIYTM